MQAVVNSWLTGYRRGNLSDFVVGTIDQVLMAGLRSKYVVLRHLALAGKVVILDEVHSNTAYMNVYMETVLSWLVPTVYRLSCSARHCRRRNARLFWMPTGMGRRLLPKWRRNPSDIQSLLCRFRQGFLYRRESRRCLLGISRCRGVFL